MIASIPVIRKFLTASLVAGMLACAPEPQQGAESSQAVAAGQPSDQPAEGVASEVPAEPRTDGANETVFDSTAQAAPDTQQPFSERVAIFIEASAADLDAARAVRDEEAFYIMADDLMFYRANAYEFLEKNGLPVRTLKGRHRLRFVVNGAAKPFDYSHVTTLDVIILYDTNREPVAVAPIEIDDAARSHYNFE